MNKVKGIAAAVLVLASVLSCGGGQQATETTKLNVYNWTYYIPDDVVADFEKEFGIEVVYDMYASNEEMYAKIQAGATDYDIVVPTQDMLSIMIKQDMLAPIDQSLVPNFAFIKEDVKSKNNYDEGFKFSVPYMIGVAGVAIDKSLVPDYVASWSIFDNPAVAGRATLLDDPRQTIGAALMYLGFSTNSVDPAELEKAKEVLLRWKNNILRFDSESQGKGFAQGEFVVVHSYAENVMKEVEGEKKDNTVFFIPIEGAAMYLDSFAILKNGPNQANAHKFINYIHRPDIYARICINLGYPSINAEADKLLEANTEYKPNYRIEDLATSELYLDVGKNLELYNNVWQSLRSGQ